MRVSLSRKTQIEPDSSQPECIEYSSCMFWRRYYRDEAPSYTTTPLLAAAASSPASLSFFQVHI